MARILVVEDERDVATLVKFTLEKDGHSVIAAHEGKEALAKIGLDPVKPEIPLPDLIVLDIMMPVMGGYQLNMRLQEEARAKNIPVLVLTARGPEMRDLFSMAPNVAAYVQKPFDPQVLRELIAGILASHGGK